MTGMNFLQFLKKLFRKKPKDNSFYTASADHTQKARELDEVRKRAIMRSLQALKSAEDYKREIGAETFQGENYFKQTLFINFQTAQQTAQHTELKQMIYLDGNVYFFPTEDDDD